MISHIRGTVLHLDLKYIVIETSGIGYKVSVTPETVTNLTHHNGKEVTLWTYLVIRDDAHTLYGFGSREELDLFEILISVSGIGPKTALGILSTAPHAHIIEAIGSGDPVYLSKSTGIGKKNAEKIILELRDKIGEGSIGLGASAGDALEALTALGWSDRDAREALQATDRNASVPERVTQALKRLGTQRGTRNS